MRTKLTNYGWIIKLIISIVLVIYIYNRVDFKALVGAFRLLPWYVIMVIPVIGILQVYITTITQMKLFSIYPVKIGTTETYKENYLAAFYGMAIPGIIGSDLYMVKYFGKKITSYFNAFTGIIFLRTMGLIVFIASTTFISIIRAKKTYHLISRINLEINNFIYYALIVLVTISIISCIIFRNYLKNAFSNIFLKFKPIVILIKLRKAKVFLIIFQIFLYYIVAIGGRVLVAKMCGIDLSIIELSELIMIVNLMIMLPVSYSGIGVREGGYIGLLVLMDVEKNRAVLFSLMDFTIAIFVFVVGLLISLTKIVSKKRRTAFESS